MFSSICPRTFILVWCSLCISLSHAFNTQHIQYADTSSTIAIAQTQLNEEQITTLAISLHARAKNDLGLDVDHNAQYLIHRIKLFLSFRAHQHEDTCQEASTFCYINQLDYTAENFGPKFTELQTRYGAPSLDLLFKHLLIRPAHDTISEATIAYDFSVLLCQYWQTISTSLDRAQANIDLASSLTTLARKPFTQDRITTIAQEAITRCITPPTRRHEATLQSKLAALLTFRSQLQPESLRGKNAALIIHQQNLKNGYFQANQSHTTVSSSTTYKQSWSDLFKNKLLTESTNQQTEITWANETASLLIQYWPIYAAYQSRKKREEIKKLMNSIANDATTAAQPSTIAKMPLTQGQITTIAQEAIANCMTQQTRKYEATLQKRLSALLAFRSKMQPENLRNQSARLIIYQQHLHHGYIQTDQYDNSDVSSSVSTKQSWHSFFKNKLLTESNDEQAEIAWAHEVASLLVKYLPTYNVRVAQKHRERITRKREQAYDSVEETQELLRKNRRRNDSPVPFVPIADEQTPASTAFNLLMDSNGDALDDTLFPVSSNSFYPYPSTSIIEDYFQIREDDEN